MRRYFQIPTQPGKPFSERVTLQGIEYLLKFDWNPVSQIWMLEIYDSGGTVAIVRGIALVTGADLLGQFSYLTVAAHAVLMAMTTGPGISPDEEPTFTNLGIDGQLIYVSP
jgi:hypothetical protein